MWRTTWSQLAALALVSTACSSSPGEGGATTSGGQVGASSSSSSGAIGGETSTTSSAATGGGGAAASSVSASSGATGGSGGQGGAGGGGPPPDPCSMAHPTCPSNPPTQGGQGLQEIDRCNFSLVDGDTWASARATFASIDLPKATMTDILADLNRVAVPKTKAQIPGSIAGFDHGFGWQAGDETVGYWVPQGLTGSADATTLGTINGRRVILATWYYDQAAEQGSTVEKGVRIAIVDDTDPTSVHYRLLLLVVPKAGNPASFESVGIVHAGGAVWFDPYLYIPDTSHGFRVFDLSMIRKVDASKDEVGYDATDHTYYGYKYQYVVPQVGFYTSKSECGPRFSFLSLDRSVSPPELIAGEYCGGAATCGTYDGRLFRYAIDPSNSRLGPNRVFAIHAYYQGETQLQGAVSHDGTYYLSSSQPSGTKGALFVLPNGGPSTSHSWVDMPEDLLFDPNSNRLYGQSELNGSRYIFSADVSGY